MNPIPVIMPIAGAESLTEAAIADVLAQSVPIRLLLINQGVETPFRRRLEAIAEEYADRVFLWSHDPPLPSLAATWNRGLQWAWECGATEAWVVNNDCRFDPRTASILHAVLTWPTRGHLFVSAVGVTQDQYEGRPDPLFDRGLPAETTPTIEDTYHALAKGGPDFSCFLISLEGHAKYPFDEAFCPAYGEDCSCHREYMLGGDGDKIFSINLPFHHVGGGSGTLKSMTPEKRAALEHRIGQSREYYARKWGPGGVNHETFTIPFDPASAQPGVTNPELQAAIWASDVQSPA